MMENTVNFENGVHIESKRMSDGEEIQIHTNDGFELFYVCDGKSQHKIDGEKYIVESGDLLIINYNTTHKFIVDGFLDYISLVIKPAIFNNEIDIRDDVFFLLSLGEFSDFLTTLDSGKCLIHFANVEQKHLDVLFDIFQFEYERNNSGKYVMLKASFELILVYVFRKMSLKLSETFQISNELLSYIRVNCGNNLTMTDIARKCFYNPAYFSKIFKEYVGMNFSQYLNKCRIETACYLLRHTKLKIDDIISECGFGNRTKFFKQFKSEMGVSPLKYRKIMK